MQYLITAAQVASSVSTIIALVILFVRPIRERVMGVESIRGGQRCLLRSDMLHAYYKHREDKTIRQFEFENFIMEYGAYKALKGNSFIDKIYEEVKTWEILT